MYGRLYRFLVSLKEVEYSEKILKIKSIIKEEFNIDNNLKITNDSKSNIQLQKFCEGCCEKRLVDENTTSGVCHKLLSLALNNYVFSGFGILDTCETTIRKANVPTLKKAKHLPWKFLFNHGYRFICSTHKADTCAKDIRVMVNVFFNNRWKYSTESVVNDQVVPLKNSNALYLVLHSLYCYDQPKLQNNLYLKLCTNLI